MGNRKIAIPIDVAMRVYIYFSRFGPKLETPLHINQTLPGFYVEARLKNGEWTFSTDRFIKSY